jgi:hypothetical protein
MDPWPPPHQLLVHATRAASSGGRSPLLPGGRSDASTAAGNVGHSPFSSMTSSGSTAVTPPAPGAKQPTLPPRAHARVHADESSAQRRQYWNTVLIEGESSPALSSATLLPLSESPSFQKLPRVTADEGAAVPPACKAGGRPTRAASLLENMMTDRGAGKPADRPGPDASSAAGTASPGADLRLGVAVKQKRFQCHMCAATFAQRGDMMRHIRVKGNQPAPCVQQTLAQAGSR